MQSNKANPPRDDGWNGVERSAGELHVGWLIPALVNLVAGFFNIAAGNSGLAMVNGAIFGACLGLTFFTVSPRK